MKPLPAVGVMWADAIKGLPVDDLDEWRATWCGTCRHGTQACRLSGVLDTGYTPAQISSSLEHGTACTHHSPTGHPDAPVSPPVMPHAGTGRPRPSPGPTGRPVQFHGPPTPTHVPIADPNQSDPQMVPSVRGTEVDE